MPKSALSLILSLLIVVGCGKNGVLLQPVSVSKELEEKQLVGFGKKLSSKHKIAIIDVDGMIINKNRSGFLQAGENPVSLLHEKLYKAQEDDKVKAVVLRINSPGGTVSASEAMYYMLKQFKEKSKKPVVACMLDVAASGGYLLAVGCDEIVAQPSTITGSIGTIYQMMSFKGTMDKIGVQALAIKSGDLKDMSSPLKDFDRADQKVLTEMINTYYDAFLDAILENRDNLDRDTLKTLADGRVYTATQALDHGLIDHLGYPEDAVKRAEELAGIKKAKVVIYQRPYDHKTNAYSSGVESQTPQSLINLSLPQWLQSQGPQFLYLWQGFDM